MPGLGFTIDETEVKERIQAHVAEQQRAWQTKIMWCFVIGAAALGHGVRTPSSWARRLARRACRFRLVVRAPVVVSLAAISCLVLFIDSVVPKQRRLQPHIMVVPWKYVYRFWTRDWFRVVTYTFSHKDMAHLTGNFSSILLIGPLLEQTYGSWRLLRIMLVTTALAGVLSSVLFSTALIGASTIVFLFLILGSSVACHMGVPSAHGSPGKGRQEVPVSFACILVLTFGREIAKALQSDGTVSHFSHAVGGLIGGVLGLGLLNRFLPPWAARFLGVTDGKDTAVTRMWGGDGPLPRPRLRI